MITLRSGSSWLLAAVIAIQATGCGFDRPKAKVTIHVVDETGTPVEGATVSISGSFHEGSGSRAVGVTTTNGLFSASVRSHGSIAGFIEKPGHYRTIMPEFFFNQGPSNDYNSALRRGKWLPWNPTNTAVLKRIVRPVPLIVRGGELTLPAYDALCGYDLMVRDWVAPFGTGKTSDLVFEHHLFQRAEDYFDYQLTVRFSNTLDGLIAFDAPISSGVSIGSRLRSAHYAPEGGYVPKWVQQRSRRPGQAEKNSRSDTRNFYIRVRSQVDGEGRIQSAHYGKIYGDFMNFRSFLNPTPNDRNLEYAPPEDDGISPL